MLIIFLDFDGVLHRKMNGNFELLFNFKKILDKYPEINLVITSEWRHELKRSDYQSIFGDYSKRIIGKTIKLMSLNREEEILAFVRENQIKYFIAIDDDCRNTLFYPNCSWLFKTDYFCGLDEKIIIKLDLFIQDQIINVHKLIKV